MAEYSIPRPTGLSQLPTSTETGIYFLWYGSAIVYVGQARNIRERVCQHIAERKKSFDGFSFIRCGVGQLNALERKYISGLLPRLNNCCLSQSLRRLKASGVDLPTIDPDARQMSWNEFHGLTSEQFAWLRNQPDGPRPIRLPRSNIRRFVRKNLDKWAKDHPAMIAAARLV